MMAANDGSVEGEMARIRTAATSARLMMAVAMAGTVTLTVMIFAVAPARAQEKTPGSEADSQAIKQVFAEWYQAFSRHDAHAVSMVFAEDADFTNMGGAHNRGRKEIEAHMARIFAGNLKSAKRTDIVKRIRFFSPDLAEVDADTEITGTLAADGSEMAPRKGLMITTMTKEKGKWYISVFHEVEFPQAAPAAR